MSKLKAHDITGNIMRWIEHWLQGKKNRVVINGYLSEWIHKDL